jgi:1A family penicillin-binding protein
MRTDLGGWVQRTRDRGRRRRAERVTSHGTRKARFRWLIGAVAVVILVAAVGVSTASIWMLRDLPFDTGMVDVSEREILLEAADGRPLGRVGPLKISNAERNEFPEQLVAAVLSIEDRRFYSHWGVDLVGILRALLRNYDSGSIVQGGSTITQQLVKLRIVGSERTFARKLREALAAIWLERHLTKDEILTRYLNSVYMGSGAQGVPAAAKLYFNKKLKDLSLLENATLAGLIKAPSRSNPVADIEAARQRARVVLDAMVETGAIDAAAAEKVKALPLALAHPILESPAAPWFSDWVAQEAQQVSGSFSGTMRMRTTLDPRLQEQAERAVASGLAKGARLNVSQASLVAMRPDGAVVAMVGGRDYKASQFNRAVQARRQAGSVFKLFVYLAALRNGYKLEDTVDASAIEIRGWEPENFGGREYGALTLADAFARSINTAAVRLAVEVGIDNVIQAARDLGITAPLPRVPSLALGSADVSLLELTAAFASVRAQHAPVHPWGVSSFVSPIGSRTMQVGAPAGPRRNLGAPVEQVVRLLSLPVERGTARSAALDGFSAGKTGTTQNHRDAWFIGFNDRLVAGVWVGNDDGTSMSGVTGGSLPAAIWKQFMQAAAGTPAADQGQAVSTSGAQTQPTSSDQEYVQCDVRTCAARYQSFRASDCTYQPYDGGPRTRCEKSSGRHRAASALAEVGADLPEAAGRCNYDVCSTTYNSFRASDCTYQPYNGGPRRMCER